MLRKLMEKNPIYSSFKEVNKMINSKPNQEAKYN